MRHIMEEKKHHEKNCYEGNYYFMLHVARHDSVERER